jgi:hypothetical protein
LLATIDFNVNALLFDVKKNHFYEKGAINAIKEKTIGFNAEKTYDKGLLAYRLLLIRHKIGFYPSRRSIQVFTYRHVDLDMMLWIKKTLESKVGKELCELFWRIMTECVCIIIMKIIKNRKNCPNIWKVVKIKIGDQQP